MKIILLVAVLCFAGCGVGEGEVFSGKEATPKTVPQYQNPGMPTFVGIGGNPIPISITIDSSCVDAECQDPTTVSDPGDPESAIGSSPPDTEFQDQEIDFNSGFSESNMAFRDYRPIEVKIDWERDNEQSRNSRSAVSDMQ